MMTFLVAQPYDRIDAPCVLGQPVNGQVLNDYAGQCLLSTLSADDVVSMDHLGSQENRDVRKAIRSVGAKLLFLPPYSPDMNPIEQSFAKLQAYHAQGRRRQAKWPMTNVRNLALPRWRRLAERLENRWLIRPREFCEWTVDVQDVGGGRRKGEMWFRATDRPLFAIAGFWQATVNGNAFAMVKYHRI